MRQSNCCNSGRLARGSQDGISIALSTGSLQRHSIYAGSPEPESEEEDTTECEDEETINNNETSSEEADTDDQSDAEDDYHEDNDVDEVKTVEVAKDEVKKIVTLAVHAKELPTVVAERGSSEERAEQEEMQTFANCG